MKKCVICGCDFQDKDENMFQSIAHKFELVPVCDACISHVTNGGKFIRTPIQTDDFSYGDTLNAKIQEWLCYKARRKQKYTERGLQSFLTQVKNAVKKTSEDVVTVQIAKAITSKWEGVHFNIGTIPNEELENMFNSTWQSVVNAEGRESAKRYYIYLFRKFTDIERAKTFGRDIYKAYKQYVSTLSDIKYCKTFEKFLKSEIPIEKS